jgi:hypothetical protein
MGFALIKDKMRIFAVQNTPNIAALDAGAPRHNRFSVNRTAGAMPVWQPKGVEPAAFAPQLNEPKIETGQKFGFKDMLDVINPLQHIPVIDNIYRKMTGDEISAPAQFMGGMLFGGPIGGVAAMADIAMREQTGKGIGDRVASMFGQNTGQNNAPDIKIASRWPEKERMAGSIPVWGAQKIAPTIIPGENIAPETNFAMLLNRLSDNTPNIS